MSEAVISGLWIGPRLSTMQQLSIRSFLAHGHPFHLYVYEEVQGVPPGTTLRNGREILPESAVFCYHEGFGQGSPAAFSNLFRYQLLLQRGGWWSDLDMICLRPLRFATEYVFGQQYRPDGTRMVNSAIIRVPPESDLMRYCWAKANAVDRQSVKWGQIGPLLMNEAVAACDLQHYALPPEAFYAIRHWEVERFLSNTPVPPDSHCVHLWDAMWKHRGLDPDAHHPPNCLYETLKATYLARE